MVAELTAFASPLVGGFTDLVFVVDPPAAGAAGFTDLVFVVDPPAAGAAGFTDLVFVDPPAAGAAGFTDFALVLDVAAGAAGFTDLGLVAEDDAALRPASEIVTFAALDASRLAAGGVDFRAEAPLAPLVPFTSDVDEGCIFMSAGEPPVPLARMEPG